MPMTPLSGVRISWLIVARNSDLRRDAASAASLARCNSASICLRVVTSWPKPMISTNWPAASHRFSAFQARIRFWPDLVVRTMS